MDQNDINWLLEQEGLNQYQRGAYCALLELKTAAVSEIAKRGRVPEGKLYEVLRSLESKGLIESNVGRPKKFSIIDPTKAFSKAITGREQSIARERKILEQASTIAAQTSSKEETIRLMRGRDMVLAFLNAHIKEKVEKSMDSCFPFQNPYAPIMTAIREKARKGIEFRIIGEVTHENYPIVSKYLKWGVHIRNCRNILPPSPLRFSVYDENAAAFTLTDANRDYITIWTDSQPIVKSIGDLFNYYWNNGLDVE